MEVNPDVLQALLTFLGGVLAVGIPAAVTIRKQSKDAALAMDRQSQATAALVLQAQSAAKESLDASESRFRETILQRLDKQQAEIDILRTENVDLRISNASLGGELKVFQYENEKLKNKVSVLESELHSRRIT